MCFIYHLVLLVFKFFYNVTVSGGVRYFKANDCHFSDVIPSFSFVLCSQRFSVLRRPSPHPFFCINFKDLSLAAAFVSATHSGTPCRRIPDLAAKSKHRGGDVELDTMDPGVRGTPLAVRSPFQN